MLRSFGITVALLLLVGLMPQPVSAAIIFSDNFTITGPRPAGDSVGNGWAETEQQSNDVSLVVLSGTDGAMQIRDSSGLSAQLALSTLGFQNITVSYDWAPLENSDTGDLLIVEWRPGNSGSFINLGTLDLGGTGGVFTSVGPIALGPTANNISPLQLEFRVTVSNGTPGDTEGALVDNFVLSGDAIVAVPEPASLAVWGLLAIAGVAYGRRRKSA
jgi:hypothetical protein